MQRSPRFIINKIIKIINRSGPRANTTAVGRVTKKILQIKLINRIEL